MNLDILAHRLLVSLAIGTFVVLLLPAGAHGAAASTSALAPNRGDEVPGEIFGLLAERRYADAYPELNRLAGLKNQQASFILANYYVCGRVVEFDCKRAQALFIEASHPSGNPQSEEIVRAARNEIAWMNAACEQTGFTRNAELALTLAKDAAQTGNPYFLDTLAAAYANSGDYAKAQSTQQQALDTLKIQAQSDAVEAYTFVEFQNRLALYVAHRPARLDKQSARANCNALP